MAMLKAGHDHIEQGTGREIEFPIGRCALYMVVVSAGVEYSQNCVQGTAQSELHPPKLQKLCVHPFSLRKLQRLRPRGSLAISGNHPQTGH